MYEASNTNVRNLVKRGARGGRLEVWCDTAQRERRRDGARTRGGWVPRGGGCCAVMCEGRRPLGDIIW